jgi:dihydroneopterin triphosphate diphosphatase
MFKPRFVNSALLKLERVARQWLYWDMLYKQPRSVQVVVFAECGGERQYLLLKRKADRGGFWQSVTGSLEVGETRAQAAVREVFEETGIAISESQLIDLDVINVFEIAPQWLARYAPGVTTNEEFCFALKVDKCEIRIDANEHEAACWVNREMAAKMIYWESNKRAFAAAETIVETIAETMRSSNLESKNH